MSIAAADALMGIFGMKRVTDAAEIDFGTIKSRKEKQSKPKKCSQCRCEFQPQRPMQKVCSPACAQSLARKSREKVERAADRQKRESLKSRAQWMREAQSAFNAYIRQRDDKEPCISCGRHHQGQYHAGHYLSVGARPELRFNEKNVHKQCQPCNTHLSGNAVLYRKALLVKIGAEWVDSLEGNNPPMHYGIDDLKLVKAQYVAKLKELKHG